MKTRKEQTRLYKEQPIIAGIYVMMNEVTRHYWMEKTRNLKTINGRQFELKLGTSMNHALQAEWNAYGATAFQCRILSEVDTSTLTRREVDDQLDALLERWQTEFEV